MQKNIKYIVLLLICSAFTTLSYYPIDGYLHTGIKRLKYLELVKSWELKSTTVIPTGAQNYMDIELNLISKKEDSTAAFLSVDEPFQKDINALFRGLDMSSFSKLF